MNRCLPVLTYLLLATSGCDRPPDNGGGDPSTATPAELTPVTRTRYGVSFDPKTVAPGSHSFSAPGLGGGRIIIHGRIDGDCQFDYIESSPSNAYTWRRVRVPVSDGPVTVSVGDGAFETSFSLEKAAVLWSGDGTAKSPGEAERMKKIPTTKQPIAGESFYDNYFRDEVAGEGPEASAGKAVAIRCRVFANEYFDEPLPGFTEPRELRFRLGEGKAGISLEAAVAGMKVGGKRRVMVWEQLSDALRAEVGGWQPDMQMPVEIELVEVN